MAEFEFRVIEPVRYLRVASDPRESYRFLQQIDNTPGATRSTAASNQAQPLPITTPAGKDQPSSQEVTHNV